MTLSALTGTFTPSSHDRPDSRSGREMQIAFPYCLYLNNLYARRKKPEKALEYRDKYLSLQAKQINE
jgi:hypothetical protein